MLSSQNRHRLFRAGFSAMTSLKADRWLAPAAQGIGLILTFHHVRPSEKSEYAPNALLSITPEFLDHTLTVLSARGFEMIGLDALPERLRAPGRKPPFVVLTFDDGYRDNLQHAAPILARHRAPWTLFVTSDFAEGRGRLWWIELERAIARLDRVHLRSGDQRTGPIDLLARDPREKSAAFESVYRQLRSGTEARLLEAIASLCDAAGIAVGAVAEEMCLRWSELRTLSADPLVTIGAHTLGHPMLAKHDRSYVVHEMQESRRRIREEMGSEVRHFSYPVGDPGSAGAREFAIAGSLGFATAVTTRPGHLFARHAEHLHALPRVSVNGLHQTHAALASLISGVPFLAWNRGRRLNVD